MITKIKLFIVINLTFLTTLGCTRSLTDTSTKLPDQLDPPGLPTGEGTHILNLDGRQRSYLLYVPVSLDQSLPAALVFVFHGGLGNAESAVRMSGFNEVADRNSFLVVYPNGTGRFSNEKLLTWNGGDCCGYAQDHQVDDIAFVRAIVADLEVQANLDDQRIYATGMSNGGILSQRLACEAADLFAAIAPVAGTLNYSPCHPSAPVAVIEFHGTADENILYEGGFGEKSLVEVDFTSVQISIDFWVSFNGCDPHPQREVFTDIRHEIWKGCIGSSSVELYSIIGGGHTWPGGQKGSPGADQPSMTISASQVIWDFFNTHPR